MAAEYDTRVDYELFTAVDDAVVCFAKYIQCMENCAKSPDNRERKFGLDLALCTFRVNNALRFVHAASSVFGVMLSMPAYKQFTELPTARSRDRFIKIFTDEDAVKKFVVLDEDFIEDTVPTPPEYMPAEGVMGMDIGFSAIVDPNNIRVRDAMNVINNYMHETLDTTQASINDLIAVVKEMTLAIERLGAAFEKSRTSGMTLATCAWVVSYDEFTTLSTQWTVIAKRANEVETSGLPVLVDAAREDKSVAKTHSHTCC